MQAFEIRWCVDGANDSGAVGVSG